MHWKDLQKEIFSKTPASYASRAALPLPTICAPKRTPNWISSRPQTVPPGPRRWSTKVHSASRLFVRLKKWREDVAECKRVERYQVMHTRTLLELVQSLPQILAELKKIKGSAR